MPIPLGFWEWGCRNLYYETVKSSLPLILKLMRIRAALYLWVRNIRPCLTFEKVFSLSRKVHLFPSSHPKRKFGKKQKILTYYKEKIISILNFSILKKSVYKGTKEDNVRACLLAQRNISSPIQVELGLPQGFDHVPGNKVSLEGILNLSEKRLAVGITVWSDELLVQSDDNELDEDVREKLCEKRKKKKKQGKNKYH